MFTEIKWNKCFQLMVSSGRGAHPCVHLSLWWGHGATIFSAMAGAGCWGSHPFSPPWACAVGRCGFGSVSPVQMQQQGPTLLCTSHVKGSPAPWDTNRGITPHDTGWCQSSSPFSGAVLLGPWSSSFASELPCLRLASSQLWSSLEAGHLLSAPLRHGREEKLWVL